MTRVEIEKALTELNQLVLSGKAMDAFEKFYHDDVVMQENDLPPTETKSVNRARELDFFSKISEFRNAEVKGMGVGDNISFVWWKYHYTHQDWGVRDYSQVSIQEWKDGQIIRERFVYAN